MTYEAMTWSQERRMVVIRRPIREPPSWQLTLFKMGRHPRLPAGGQVYQVIATNRDLEPLHLWGFYNGRSAIELVIREWKHGWPLANSPGRDWKLNAAWFHLALFACNLLNWFKCCAAPASLRTATVGTVRERLSAIPANLVRPQGRPTLRLPNGYPYREAFEQTSGTISRLGTVAFPAAAVAPWFSQWQPDSRTHCHKSSEKR